MPKNLLDTPGGGGGKGPPPPPGLKPLNVKRPSAVGNSFQKGEKVISPPKQKLKPLHWDKVKAAPDQSMVWDDLSKSFE